MSAGSAYEAGRNARLRGKQMDANPFRITASGYQAWNRGWRSFDLSSTCNGDTP